MLAPNAACKDSTQALLNEVRSKEDSRADYLLSSLVRSAEIYSYYREGAAQHSPALLLKNNTTREALLKEQFIMAYRAMAANEREPKALFKFGTNHMYHGRGPGGAWTLGNLAHEVATFDRHEAVGVFVLAVGGYTAATWHDLPKWVQPLLPAISPDGPVLVELEPLRGEAGQLATGLTGADRTRLVDLIHAFELLVVLPHSSKADWQLTGFPPP